MDARRKLQVAINNKTAVSTTVQGPIQIVIQNESGTTAFFTTQSVTINTLPRQHQNNNNNNDQEEEEHLCCHCKVPAKLFLCKKVGSKYEGQYFYACAENKCSFWKLKSQESSPERNVTFRHRNDEPKRQKKQEYVPESDEDIY